MANIDFPPSAPRKSRKAPCESLEDIFAGHRRTFSWDLREGYLLSRDCSSGYGENQ